ncbi:ComEC/Rec2 family competence protein [Arcobacter sp. LA11]|uniref:ComEC/Rec2 family competence protein n=1 Tax=Arcobacter sp. LA11 TaxID=1898176 RepID=UPI000933BC54|nr:ComEC/Rec2 family competence protein [Arcobacter sp. LA11]
MNRIKLISSKKELFFSFLFFLSIFLFNIFYEYNKYLDLVEEELYSGKFEIVNIYDKNDFYVLKVKSADFSFFTSIDKKSTFSKLEEINLAIVTTKIDFYSFLKGFYAKTIYYDTLPKTKSFKKDIQYYINDLHNDIRIKELFNALFLAIPISKEYREIYTNFGISHLIAISGFHLAIIVGVVYWLIYFLYSYIHQRYFLYRNKRFDILILTLVVLFFYLLLIDFVPSMLRAFIMFFIGVYFLRRNIEIFSFQTLLITLLLIISFLPKYLFSISLWFSIIGVFYIFLYLQYFKNVPKILAFFLFNFWIFLVFNPIVHFFFYNTSYEQLLSPFITLFFSIFYPLELFLHFVGLGSLFDKYIVMFLDYKMIIFEVITPYWFFVLYVITSLGSIFYKSAFVLLNILLVLFNIYLYVLF